jgi:hypothetical protein
MVNQFRSLWLGDGGGWNDRPARIQISHWFFINAYGDVGGFGAGSELMWQALLGSGIQVSRWFAMIAGYRALGYDFRQNDTKLDLISHGPYAGIEITF